MKRTYRRELPDHPPEAVFRWHERPGALERLTPPWGDVRVVHREGGIRDGGEVELEIGFGPTHFRWRLRHFDYEAGRRFRDEQISGPLKHWRHTHRFLPREGGGTVLEDELEIEAPLGFAGAAIAPAMVERELDRLFSFRYRRLELDLERHAADRGPPLRVAITGSSGLVGRNLRHFLTTGGHEVVRLVRRREAVGPHAIHWDPATGAIDAAGLEGVDAVVHLAGAPVAPGRWTDARKRSILESRVRGTELLARTLAGLGSRAPRVLVTASGVHFYGDRGGEILREDAGAGRGFMADVTKAWELAARPAEQAGIRVVRLRTGMVLSPAGGALGEMLLPFKLGAGGRLGSGRQYMSWIDLDDHVAVILHALRDEGLRGPVNAVAPHPVTNATFTSALGRVLGRPTIIPVPALAVRAAFGEMGEELLLQGQRVLPAKLAERGFRFAFESVEESLRFQLGHTGTSYRVA